MEKATLRTLCMVFLLTSSSVFSQNGSNFIGQVLYHDNYPLAGVNAYLQTSGGTIIDTAITDADGNYEFENVTPGNYKITFSTALPEGGIELNDAFLVMLKLFNLYQFTPIQTKAADVNGSGTITWIDYTMILIGYLNQGNPFPVGPWVFESITTPIPTESRDVFTTGGGSSSGDVNGSLQPDPKSNSIFMNNPVVKLTTDPASPIEFNLSAGQNIQMVGMHLAIITPENLEVISVESAIPEANIYISENQVNVTWIDSTRQGFTINESTSLLVIRAKVTDPSRNGMSCSFKLGNESHFINTDGALIKGVSLILPTIDLNYEKNLTFSAYPNPFCNSATIEYNLQQEGHINIELYDHAGRLVQEMENGIRSAGSHQVKIEGQLLLPGLYHYSIRFTGSEQALYTGTIIKSK